MFKIPMGKSAIQKMGFQKIFSGNFSIFLGYPLDSRFTNWKSYREFALFQNDLSKKFFPENFQNFQYGFIFFRCRLFINTELKTHKYMKKNTVKINENTLKQIVAESVKKVLKESDINNRDFDMSPEAVSYRNGNLRGEPQYINPQSLKADIEQLIHYLMVSEGDSPRAQKAYQKALQIKQDIFNKIDLLNENK